MRTITPEERCKFLARSRQAKLETASNQPDPLSQLGVEDETFKG
ncbi:hypothetical protein A2U01_0110099, partial [Trifolium medium]|nr:hypothetical protein [Trifolium medium]